MENKATIKQIKLEFLCEYSEFNKNDMLNLIKSESQPITDDKYIEYYDNYALDNLDSYEYDCYKNFSNI